MNDGEKPQAATTGSGVNRRDFMGRAAALGFTTALAGSLAPALARAETPKRGGHLVIGLDGAGAGDSIDPATYTAPWLQVVGMQFYNTLLEVDENNVVKPSLAESWEAKEGAKVWVVKLRKGVTFHNGKELTAADVVYSYNHHRAKDSKSPAKAILAAVDDIKASDKYEITFTLSAGNADLPYILADYHICIVPEGVPHDKGIGTGAFILQKFEPGVRAITKRNPNYWNSNRGWVDSVETLAINDPTARLSALQSSSVHMINRIGPKVVDLVKKLPKLQVFNISGAGHYCFPMRCDMAPFNNNDVRLAIKYGIDREQIIDKILRGYGKVGNDNPIPSFDPFFAADIPQRKFDPDKAKFHMKKSGYTGSIPLSISDVAFSGAVETAQLMQATMAKAGIKLELNREAGDGYWDNVWMKKAFCGSYWGGRPTADMMLSTTYESTAPWNESFWMRPDFDKILVAARAELDVGKRKQMYHDLQAMVVDDCGELIPMFNNFLDGATIKVKGFVPTPTQEMSGLRAAEKVWLDA
ncbi:MAG: peptide/nickel transport system substrate-binding protein [Rhodospirillaceae bacterium]|nr:peptide/nickel transport system substrate-binding protein [Rhodospirillaceae bacterium]